MKNKLKTREIGRIIQMEGLSYIWMDDGKIFKYEDSEICPRVLPLRPEETDKVALYFLELKLEEENPDKYPDE